MDLNQVIWPPNPTDSHCGGNRGEVSADSRRPPTPTYHIDEADGGLHIIGLGDHDLRGGEHLHQCLVLLQRHQRWVWHLDPDGEGAGLGVLLEHLWADTRWGEQGHPWWRRTQGVISQPLSTQQRVPHWIPSESAILLKSYKPHAKPPSTVGFGQGLSSPSLSQRDIARIQCNHASKASNPIHDTDTVEMLKTWSLGR